MRDSAGVCRVLCAVRPGVALFSIVGHAVGGVVVGRAVISAIGADALWPLFLFLSPIWLMGAVVATVAGLDRLRLWLGRANPELVADTAVGDVPLAAMIGAGGAALCVVTWAASAAMIYPMLGLAVALVVGVLWEAIPRVS